MYGGGGGYWRRCGGCFLQGNAGCESVSGDGGGGGRGGGGGFLGGKGGADRWSLSWPSMWILQDARRRGR